MPSIARRILLVVSLVAALVPLAGPPARPAHAAAVNPIMGGSTLTPSEIAAWFQATTKKPYRATVPVETLAELFVDEGYGAGVRGDIAFAQSILETGWFEFPDYGQVRPEDNNFAGIGACNSCSGGYEYADARTGVRAQVQHLRKYADPDAYSYNLDRPAVQASYDSPFVYRGKAPNWEDLNGKWAVPGTDYGQRIIGIYAQMLTYSGVGPDCPPDAPPGRVGTAGEGYWMVASDGGVFSFGQARFHGSTGALTLNAPMIGMAPTPSGDGYWLLARDGGIFSFGDAGFFGSTGAMALNQPIVGMAPTPSGDGYWLVARDGGIFSFGDAGFFGSTGAMALNQPIVGMAPTPSGDGYWLVARDGGIFSFGDAGFFGSTGAMALNQPIVGMAAAPSGSGYWLVAFDGGIFAFGDAPFAGSLAGCELRWVTGMQASPTGAGYWITSAEGRVAAFGDAHHHGWPFTTNTPPLAMAVLP